MENKILEWQAWEYQLREKTGDWFWVVGIIAVSIAVAAILFKNFLFGVLILVATFALMLQAVRKPRLLRFQINSISIAVGRVAYPLSSLEIFWLDETNPADRRLLLKSKNLTTPLIAIPLGEMEPALVRNFLTTYLKEEELHEPLAQKIMEAVGF